MSDRSETIIPENRDGSKAEAQDAKLRKSASVAHAFGEFARSVLLPLFVGTVLILPANRPDMLLLMWQFVGVLGVLWAGARFMECREARRIIAARSAIHRAEGGQ